MVISVDRKLKRKIQIETRKQIRGIYYLWLFEKNFFRFGYCIVTGNFVSTNTRTGELSYF